MRCRWRTRAHKCCDLSGSVHSVGLRSALTCHDAVVHHFLVYDVLLDAVVGNLSFQQPESRVFVRDRASTTLAVGDRFTRLEPATEETTESGHVARVALTVERIREGRPTTAKGVSVRLPKLMGYSGLGTVMFAFGRARQRTSGGWVALTLSGEDSALVQPGCVLTWDHPDSVVE